MIVYIDARCLQDENFAFRGVGYHSYTLLKYAKKYNVRKLIAILDDELPPLKEKHLNLFDSIQTYSTATETKHPNESVFLVFNKSLASLVSCAIIWQRVTIAGIKSVSIDPMKNKIKL